MQRLGLEIYFHMYFSFDEKILTNDIIIVIERAKFPEFSSLTPCNIQILAHFGYIDGIKMMVLFF